MVLDVGGLGLEHQARDVDPGRAFGTAEVAVDAEVGVLAEFLGPPEPGVDRAAGHLADQVGLGARGGRLVTRGAERRAHPHGRLARPAGAATVASQGMSRGNPARASAGPGAARARPWPGSAGRRHVRREAAEVAGHQVRVVADDLAGIEPIQRVEGVLDLAEDLDPFPERPAQELGPGEPQAGFAGDRPARGVDRLADLARQRLQLGDVAGVGEVEERAGVQRPIPGVGVERPAHVVPLQDVLERLQELGQGLGGDREVLDERDGAPRPLHPHQERLDRADAAPAAVRNRRAWRPRPGRRPAVRDGRSDRRVGGPSPRPRTARRPRTRRSGRPRPPRRSTRGRPGRRRGPG